MTEEEILKRKIEITTQLVDEIVKSGRSVTSDCREWANRAYELRDLGSEGLTLYHRLSQMDGNAYSQYGTNANFRSALRKSTGSGGSKRTLRSFFQLCREMGFNVPDEPGITNDTKVIDRHYQPVAYNMNPDTIPGMYLDAYRDQESAFTRSAVSTGLLTAHQMEDARRVFPIGGMIDGATIFWYLNAKGEILDGKVMYYGDDCHRIKPATEEERKHKRTTWMSSKMKYQLRDHDGNPLLPEGWEGGKGWFGSRPQRPLPPPSPVGREPERGEQTHEKELTMENEREPEMVNTSKNGKQPETVVIVESEKTAIILHELINNPTDSLHSCVSGAFSFLACGGLTMLHEEMFLELQGKRIIVFPDTDTDGKTYRAWQQVCHRAEKLISQTITVSDILERYAIIEQKERKIDILDWLAANDN